MSGSAGSENKKSLLNKFRDLAVIHKLGLVCFVFVLLLLCSFLVVWYYPNTNNKEVINIAGRNRMLSQRVAINAERLTKGQREAKKELEEAIELHDKTLEILKSGGFAPGGTFKVKLPPASEQILPIIAEVEKAWIPYKKSAETILNADEVRVAAAFIGKNYSKMLFLNNELVKAFVSYYSAKGTNKSISGEIINIAGRNRMLSQRIGLISQRIFSGSFTNNEFEELKKAIQLHQSSLQLLKKGGGINSEIPPASEEILPFILRVEELWKDYKMNAEIILKSNEIHKALAYIEANVTDMLNQNKKLVNSYLAEMKVKKEQRTAEFNKVLAIVILANLLALFFVLYIVWKYVSIPLKQVVSIAKIVSIGDVSKNIPWNSKDEVGMVAYSINNLIKYLKESAEFAMSVGEGSFNKDFNLRGEQDILGIALTTMRDKLKNVANEDKKRNWVTAGLAKFADILRTNEESLEALSDKIVSNLVKYLDANQGSIFILNDDGDDKTMVLKTCYAWDRKKYNKKNIKLGEGLVGRCWQEAERIYLSDIPKDYINITSGLGEANPNNILIVPMKVEEEVFGIIEIASFKVIEAYQIEFIEKLATSIAATISSTKNNIRTATLLEESKVMTEQLQAQEEELRQNAEEMQATQEEMNRKIKELEKELNKK